MRSILLHVRTQKYEKQEKGDWTARLTNQIT